MTLSPVSYGTHTRSPGWMCLGSLRRLLSAAFCGAPQISLQREPLPSRCCAIPHNVDDHTGLGPTYFDTVTHCPRGAGTGDGGPPVGRGCGGTGAGGRPMGGPAGGTGRPATGGVDTPPD